jgi:hypothetical protein
VVLIEVAASDTVIVGHEPARISVTSNVPCPFVSCESRGSTISGELSLVAKWTVPAYAGSVAPFTSSAVTVTENGVPAVGVAVEVVTERLAVAARAVELAPGTHPQVSTDTAKVSSTRRCGVALTAQSRRPIVEKRCNDPRAVDALVAGSMGPYDGPYDDSQAGLKGF